MSTALLRRRGAARVSGVLAVCALVGTSVVVSTTAASAAEEPVAESLQTFAAEAFAPQADELPSGLIEAIERDLGISPAEYLADAAAAKVAVDVVAQLEDSGVEINATVMNGQDVTLYVAAEADVAAAEAVGAEVQIGEPEDAGLPDEIEPHEDLKGGYGYMSTAGRCSIGFNGYAADGSPVVTTAGHCNPDNEDLDWYLFDVDAPFPPVVTNPPTPWPQGEQIGTGGQFQFAGNHDAGLIAVTNDSWTPRPVVSSWGGGNGDPREGEVAVTDDVAPVVGAPTCRSGASTGYQCGSIIEVNRTVEVDKVPVTGFFTNACSAPGDSGGPFLSGTAAVGTLTGGTTGAPSDCTQWNPQRNFSFAYSTSGSATSQEAYFGDAWELAVQIAAPTVTSPEGESGPSVTFDGTVEGAGANHRVSVSIDGGEPVEGDVAANGSFSVAVEGDLEPGEHSYAVQALYGRYSESEVTEGSWTVNEAPAVEELTVESPSEGQTTSNPRPEFTGAGQPGATVALSVGETALGEAEAGEDGTWSLTPDGDLPVGVRFDAVVTQTFEDDTQEVTVAGLGIEAADITITAPEDGSSVAGDVTFTGTSFGGATIGLLLEQAVDTASDEAAPRLGLRAEDSDDVEEWAGEFEIDDAGNWTFDPAEDLPEGEYTITATATLEGGDAELSGSEAVATFTVANSGGDDDGNSDDGGDGNLPDTGSSNTTWMIVGGVALLLAGGAAVAIRARRNTTT